MHKASLRNLQRSYMLPYIYSKHKNSCDATKRNFHSIELSVAKHEQELKILKAMKTLRCPFIEFYMPDFCSGSPVKSDCDSF